MGLFFVSIFFVIGLLSLNILLSKSLYNLPGTSNLSYRLGLFFMCSLIFWGTFMLITLTYPEFFIYYLKERTSTPFFIPDINALVYHFFKNALFFSWLVWPPFLIIGAIIIVKNRLTYSEYIGVTFYAGLIVYTHLISIAVTYLDIFPFLQQYFEASAVLWFDMLDYGAYVSAFRGTFFDVSATMNVLWLVFRLSVNYNLSIISYSYFNFSKSQSFWNTFYVVWLCRGLFLLVVVYFFSGDIFSNIITIIITIVCMEALILFMRRSAKLYSWKAL